MALSELFRKMRQGVGQTTQSEVVLREEFSCPIETGTPMVEFCRAILVDVEEFTKTRHFTVGINVYTGMDLKSVTLIGSARAKPLNIYTDGKFNVHPMFPDLQQGGANFPDLKQIEQLGFEKASYVGWITREQGDNPVYVMQTSMKAPEVRAKIAQMDLGFELVPVFDASFRKR